MLERISDLTWRRPKLVLAMVGTFVIVAGVFGLKVEEHLKAAGFTDAASESEKATALLREELGYDANPGIVVVARERDGSKLDPADPALRTEVARLSTQLGKARHMGLVVNPLKDPRRSAALIAEDGRSLVISGQLASQDVESDGGEAAEDAARLVKSDDLEISIGGFAPSFNEVNDQTRDDLTKAELIAFPVLAVLLLIVFRGVIAASIPLLLGVISILGTFLMLRVMAEFVDTSLFALNIASGLSLGLAVDYALLMVSRYREELDRSGPTRAAHRATVMTAGKTALFSGLTVAAAMASLLALPQRFLYSVGAAGATVGLLSALISVLVVPSFLSLLGPKINALSVRRGPAVSDASDGWYRLAWGVMKRPVIVAVGCTAVMLAAASPLLGTVLTGPSAEAVPPNQPSYDANHYVEDHYGREITEAITVTIHGKASPADLGKLDERISAIDGVAHSAPFAQASGDTAYANFASARPALSAPAQDIVERIRSIGAPGSARMLVSGNTARFIDQKQSLRDHIPIVAAIVAVTTLLLLFLLTGSVVLPIKALLMNLMTLGATLGVLVLAFQKGWLDSPLDYTGPAAVEVTSLVFLFAIIFGLATDYAVLVMARITEQKEAGAGNEEAVAIGIAKTGRVITAAALMIAVVFLAFGVSSVFFMKQIAIGQAVGVLLDATIVRALLVPALMRLLGNVNWWAPRPLKRFHARFGFSES